MKVSNPDHQKILQQVGLHTLHYYNEQQFRRYIPHGYPDSETEAMDAVYRMYERVLLHNESGLRISFLATESYDGDSVEYTILDCFVITRQHEKHSVTAIDLEKRLFKTPSGPIPFTTILNTVEFLHAIALVKAGNF